MKYIGKVQRNSTGQIFIEGVDGNAFDISEHIGKSLCAASEELIESVVLTKEEQEKVINDIGEAVQEVGLETDILEFLAQEVDASRTGVSIIKELKDNGRGYEYKVMRFHKRYKAAGTVQGAIENAMKGLE